MNIKKGNRREKVVWDRDAHVRTLGTLGWGMQSPENINQSGTGTTFSIFTSPWSLCKYILR